MELHGSASVRANVNIFCQGHSLQTKSGAVCLKHRAKEVQRLQDKKEQAWDLYRRVPNFRRKKKEDFVKDLERKAVYNGKIDEKIRQEWTDEMQSKVQAAARQLEARERKWMESEDSSSQRRRAWEKLWEPGAFPSSPYLSSLQL